MPNISTIDPTGANRGTPTGVGQRFTTLAAWQTFAAAQATADQWAECYDGGNLGRATISAWASTPTPTVYPRIYAAATCRHDGKVAGTLGTNGAYIQESGSTTLSLFVPYAELDGLVLNTDGVGSANVRMAGTLSTGIKVRNNIVRINNASTSSPAAIWGDPRGTAPLHIENNIIFYHPSAPVGGSAAIPLPSTGSADMYIDGNTLILNGKAAYGIAVNETSPNFVRNNAVFDASISSLNAIFEDGWTYSNNAASDHGFDDWQGPTGPYVTVAADLTSSTDPKPSAASLLLNAGTTLTTLTPDAVGTVRPQGAAYDIGAIELPSGRDRRRRRHHSDIYL